MFTGRGFSKASLLLEAVANHIKEFGPVVPKSQLEEFYDQPEGLVKPEINLQQSKNFVCRFLLEAGCDIRSFLSGIQLV